MIVLRLQPELGPGIEEIALPLSRLQKLDSQPSTLPAEEQV